MNKETVAKEFLKIKNNNFPLIKLSYRRRPPPHHQPHKLKICDGSGTISSSPPPSRRANEERNQFYLKTSARLRHANGITHNIPNGSKRSKSSRVAWNRTEQLVDFDERAVTRYMPVCFFLWCCLLFLPVDVYCCVVVALRQNVL